MTLTTPEVSKAETDAPARPRRWWRQPWTVLAVVVALFLVFSLVPYVTFDPSKSRIPVPGDVPLYYPVLLIHILTASIALVTVALRIAPWFRKRFPEAYRKSERIYVFAGVVPAGITGFLIGAVSPFGPTTRASHLIVATLWLSCTLYAYRLGRPGRAIEQRKWMIRSYVLTLAPMTSRVWSGIFIVIFQPQVGTLFGGSVLAEKMAYGSLGAWLGWTLPMIGLQLYFDRKESARLRAAEAQVSPARSAR